MNRLVITAALSAACLAAPAQERLVFDNHSGTPRSRTEVSAGLVGGMAPYPVAGEVSGAPASYVALATAWAASTQRRDPRADSGGRWTPGPNAMALMRRGQTATDATSEARAMGEHAMYLPTDPARARALLLLRVASSASESPPPIARLAEAPAH
jgi:hypothetical protein